MLCRSYHSFVLAPFPLVTTDRAGNTRRFEVTFDTDESRPEELYVKALEVGANPAEIEGFQVTLVRFGRGDYRIDSISGHPSHRKAGIPDALIPALAPKLGGHIVSSSSRYPTTDTESRSVEAERMWQRLESKNLARFDKALDRYFSL